MAEYDLWGGSEFMRKKCAIRESCSTGGAIKIFSHNCGENLWYFDKQMQPISGLCGVWSFYSYSWEFSARLMILRFAVDLHCCWHSNMRLPLKTGSRGWRKNNGATSTLVIVAWNHESVKRDERTRCGANLRNASRMREDHFDFSRFTPFKFVRVEKQIVNLKRKSNVNTEAVTWHILRLSLVFNLIAAPIDTDWLTRQIIGTSINKTIRLWRHTPKQST